MLSTLRRALPPLLLLLLAAGSAAAESQRLRYLVWVGGTALFDLTLRYDLGPEGYAVALSGELVGVPSLFYDFTLSASAAGALSSGRPVPARYRLELVDDGHPEWLQLDYDAAGLPRRSAGPPLGDEGRRPLSAADIQGTLDPLGAILSLLLQGGTCDGHVAVFDGRRRFDVTLADQGAVTLGASAYSLYSGPALGCAVALEPLGGFRRSGRDLEAFPRSLTLYVGEAGPGRLPLPVRMESDTALGAMIIHLVEAEGF
jgi:hypothetical protein